jgi:hypothetical protein
MGEKNTGVARVFAGDPVCGFQNLQRTQGHVTEVADWGGDEINSAADFGFVWVHLIIGG